MDIQSTSRTRRRQWGTERTMRTLSIVHSPPSDSKIALGRIGIVLTVLFWLVYLFSTILRQFIDYGPGTFRFTMEQVSYVVIVSFLTFSALMYLLARQGALMRFRDHVRVPRADLDRHFASSRGALTVIVPSYAEEPEAIRTTLLSACLQEYPSLRVVLLLDDSPHPTTPEERVRLDRSRAIASEIRALLDEPASRFTSALQSAQQRSSRGGFSADSVRELAAQYEWAARWLEVQAGQEETTDHIGEFFVVEVLQGLAGELQLTADALNAALAEGHLPDDERVLELHRRLVWTFSAEVATFERKQFANLSHEANKAMNLNAYIGLMGGSYRVVRSPGGAILSPVAPGMPADVVIPDSDYVLTLDADSILLRDYCLRLVYFLEQPENARVAVAQTPYSAFRGASTRIERIAGATTDLQHILHQGKTFYGATFWVGANAVIRKRALEDIVETETVRGFTVKRYVQDRTVIEDTESSVDLGTHGWTLANYPERLSYSATPPDFGSLVVQRRRWANGGLLIMPKLWRQIRERRRLGEPIRWSEVLLRVNYMVSIAWASFGLLFLLVFPYDSRLLSPVVLLAALPYFIAMGSDLRYCGYRFTDIFRIYGFNLILLPVNLAGVVTSVAQAITNRKIPFARTPKVRNRTSAPLLYVVVPYLIVAFSVYIFWRDSSAGEWGTASFAGFNAVLASAAILAYMGIGASIVDIWIGLTDWLYVTRKVNVAHTQHAEAEPVAALDWQAVLHFGQSQAVPVASGPGAIDQGHRKAS